MSQSPRFAVIHSGNDPDLKIAALVQQVCRIIDDRSEPARIWCNGAEIAVPSGYLKPVTGVRFQRGDQVKHYSGIAKVDSVYWHFDRDEPVYWLSSDGKRRPTPYYNEDLGALERA